MCVILIKQISAGAKTVQRQMAGARLSHSLYSYPTFMLPALSVAGDYDEALAYYSRSISLIPSAASINNRALVHLRLSKWEGAVADCNQVLLMEDNLKARLRRATALKELGRSPEARTDLEFVLSKVCFCFFWVDSMELRKNFTDIFSPERTFIIHARCNFLWTMKWLSRN